MGSKKRALRLAANHPICERFSTTPDDEAMRLGAGSESNETQRELSQVGRVVGCQRLSSRRTNKKRSLRLTPLEVEFSSPLFSINSSVRHDLRRAAPFARLNGLSRLSPPPLSRSADNVNPD